jgi:hypothetical protein
MCCGVNPCAMNDCFSVLMMRSSLSPCADEISVIFAYAMCFDISTYALCFLDIYMIVRSDVYEDA